MTNEQILKAYQEAYKKAGSQPQQLKEAPKKPAK